MFRMSKTSILVLFAVIIIIFLIIELIDAGKSEKNNNKNNAKKNKKNTKAGRRVSLGGGKNSGRGKNSGKNPSKLKPKPKPKPNVPVKLKNANSTRSWDCCKPSCGWEGKTSVVGNKPVKNCAKDGVTKVDTNTQSVCWNNGTSYLCNDFQPWSVSPKLSYGFVAAGLAGENETMWCCACYELTITTGPAKDKKFVVQAINSLADTDTNDMDLIIPGGGVGWNTYGCQNQYNASSTGWGERYGGVGKKEDCTQLPEVLRPGCNWRFDWLLNDPNPVVAYRRIKCLTILTAKSECIRTDDETYPKFEVPK